MIEKERAEKSQKLDELKRSGHILLDQMGKGKQLGSFSLLWFNQLSCWEIILKHIISFLLPLFSFLHWSLLLLVASYVGFFIKAFRKAILLFINVHVFICNLLRSI